ncbi:MAG: type II toxin-antitoxin system VapB family antitoxin [Proteobacteria bacterium]|nr:type II toxin-antitoxin system VapB family antitoxin [Pseudomonadota bacterium]
MRTNIDIDDELLAKAMHAGPYTTKKETVEAGLRLLARQAAYREILKWEGKLRWEGDESVDWTQPAVDETAETAESAEPLAVQESRTAYRARSSTPAAGSDKKVLRRAGR